MSKRRGDWRDLLTTYALALKPNKICVGYLAIVYSLIVLVVATFVYVVLLHAGIIKPVGIWVGTIAPHPWSVLGGLIEIWMRGGPVALLSAFVPLLDPFYGASRGHFIVSVLTYIALFWVWSDAGGMISRLTALEYARDDLPTLADARQMVRAKRTAYWLAPVWPLLFLVVLVFLNFLGGLIASIPYVGPILLVPGFPLLLITSILIVMLIFFGVLSFGLMMPAVSVGGKDALDGWSTSYTYVLWGSARYIGYTVLSGAIGVAAVFIAAFLNRLLIASLTGSVNLGYLSSTSWSAYAAQQWVGTSGGFMGVIQYILGICLAAVSFLWVAYAIAFFFSAFTIIFFLLRKHVDNIEIEEIYEEAEEEEEFMPEEPAPAPEEPEAEAEEEAEEAEEAEEPAAEEVPPEVAEEGKPEPSQTSEELPEEPKVDEDRSMED